MGERAKQGEFLVFNGPDEQFIAGRAIGADSGIGGTYGVMPELFLKLNEYVIAGDFVKARKLQNEVNEVIKGLLSGPSLYAVCKYILKLRGIETGEVRGPMLPISTLNWNRRSSSLCLARWRWISALYAFPYTINGRFKI